MNAGLRLLMNADQKQHFRSAQISARSAAAISGQLQFADPFIGRKTR
jgi:hypothetical protein